MSAIDRAFIRAYDADDSVEASTLPPTSTRQRAPRRLEGHAPGAVPDVHSYLESRPRAIPAVEERERRPLSAFTAPAATVEARFQPALEVDAFRWSPVSNDLSGRRASHWGLVVQQLLAADEAGCSLVGVASVARRTGNTTVVGCIARQLVDAGKTVAVVDGDFVAAGLGRSLGIAAEIGWEDVLAGRVPLAEAVVHSLGDRIALLPLVQGGVPAAEKLDSIHASITAGVLRYHYDIVLFDLGSLADAVQGPIARRIARRCRLDGALLTVGSGQRFDSTQLALAVPELAEICLGVITNQTATN
jgi:Mrp family chromosome partitioning ATPase